MDKAYPQFAEFIGVVQDIVEQARRTNDSELELRFARIINGEYKAGVSREFMDTVMTLIQTNPDMIGTDWCEYHDFYYTSENGKYVRTRVTFDTDELVINTHTTEKVKMNNCILKTKDGIAIRIQNSSEKEVLTSDIPILVNTRHVRIQQRRSFVYRDTWSFDFSLTWEGKTKTEAEQNQHENNPVFEIEIELLDKEYFNKHENDWISTSFLLKALDFIGHDNELCMHAN